MSLKSPGFDGSATYLSATTAQEVEATFFGTTENAELKAMRVPVGMPRQPVNVLLLIDLADDFDAVDEDVVELFEGDR